MTTFRTKEGPGSARLGSDDWLSAALDIMADDGISGVKIQRLCDRLGVTKGSFYWHFENLDTFLGELAQRWAQEGGLGGTAGVEGDPGAELLEAMRMFSDPRARSLARAIRDWAQNDARARDAIRQADKALYERVKGSFVSLGFEDDDAQVRAKILYYAGVGFAHVGTLGRRASAETQLTATLEILTRR